LRIFDFGLRNADLNHCRIWIYASIKGKLKASGSPALNPHFAFGIRQGPRQNRRFNPTTGVSRWAKIFPAAAAKRATGALAAAAGAVIERPHPTTGLRQRLDEGSDCDFDGNLRIRQRFRNFVDAVG
jgi:hypothetical protein